MAFTKATHLANSNINSFNAIRQIKAGSSVWLNVSHRYGFGTQLLVGKDHQGPREMHHRPMLCGHCYAFEGFPQAESVIRSVAMVPVLANGVQSEVESGNFGLRKAVREATQ